MEASVEEEKATVAHDSTKVTVEQIAATIEKLGFECGLQKSEPDSDS